MKRRRDDRAMDTKRTEGRGDHGQKGTAMTSEKSMARHSEPRTHSEPTEKATSDSAATSDFVEWAQTSSAGWKSTSTGSVPGSEMDTPAHCCHMRLTPK
eukprot:539381-Pyramimonas_sp.AAC.1